MHRLGVAGSAHFNHAGGGGNYQCLPAVPQWGRFKYGFQSGSYMYGVEYEVNVFNPFLSSHLSGKQLHDQNAVCAVCRVPDRASEQMIPAWNTCPPSWSLEYHGYLMSSHNQLKGRSNFVCVDEDPEANPSGDGNENGGLWYPVEVKCGSLPCPNYVNGREITCAVCTK
ncbi:PREDICTED: uncharacterized protein LOC106810753 [Priapulus caudatus]|uniref:Uncharacterized protein LOC106810753 n=1 Tax=Priapulus caudatus TaxID=37621 RepID=A0ABM1EBW2_PRICU|nr:PREDICTED: uncharacterized protein LOC106810753 [Priapulus caudatus]